MTEGRSAVGGLGVTEGRDVAGALGATDGRDAAGGERAGCDGDRRSGVAGWRPALA